MASQSASLQSFSGEFHSRTEACQGTIFFFCFKNERHEGLTNPFFPSPVPYLAQPVQFSKTRKSLPPVPKSRCVVTFAQLVVTLSFSHRWFSVAASIAENKKAWLMMDQARSLHGRAETLAAPCSPCSLSACKQTHCACTREPSEASTRFLDPLHLTFTRLFASTGRVLAGSSSLRPSTLGSGLVNVVRDDRLVVGQPTAPSNRALGNGICPRLHCSGRLRDAMPAVRRSTACRTLEKAGRRSVETKVRWLLLRVLASCSRLASLTLDAHHRVRGGTVSWMQNKEDRTRPTGPSPFGPFFRPEDRFSA
jgi:hypothetical protein